jgi:P4 family phage/plasmid primase-like protien
MNEFLNAIREAGLSPPDYIEPGKLHRFPGLGKGNSNRAGWCWISEDQQGGVFGDWCTDSKQTWQAKRDKSLTPNERKQLLEKMALVGAQAEKEREKKQADSARKAAEIWSKAELAPHDHPYLIKKGIKPYGACINGDSLILPLRESEHTHSLQYISSAGDKRFLFGGRVRGCYYGIGRPNQVVLITEGFATGASVHESTGYAVAIAFNAANLLPVAMGLRERLPNVQIVICADNDTETEGNPGVTKATEAARSIDGMIAIPPQHGDFNDLAQLYGKAAVNKFIQAVLEVADDCEIDDHPDLTHDSLALQLSTSGWTTTARYVHKWAKWVFWNSQRWEVGEKLIHYTKIRAFLRNRATKFLNDTESDAASSLNDLTTKQIRAIARALRRKETIHSVESLARSNADLVVDPEQFDGNLMLIGTPGGTIDLSSGNLAKAEPQQWITKLCSTTPAEVATPAPLWLAFLDRIFNSNQELINFMQRAAGYALTGHTREHKLFFLYGTGRNGKSVFLDTIFQIMGDYSRRSASQIFLDNTNDPHPTGLAGLMGARLVAGSELPAGKAWNESIIKDLTGGDVITARFMRQDFFDYMPQFKLFIAGNHQPAFRGIDEAIRARVILVPFTETIPEAERDLKLTEKLKQEWPAILRWMIEGAVEWNTNGLEVPDVIKTASAEYLDAEDTFGEFLTEHVEPTPGGKVTCTEVYERFTNWQNDNGIRQPWTKKAMTQAMKERDIETAKLAKGARGFKGIVLKTEGQYPNKWNDG